MRKYYFFLLFFSLLLTSSYADLGPKPDMDIYVYYNGDLVNEDFNSYVLTCRYLVNDLNGMCFDEFCFYDTEVICSKYESCFKDYSQYILLSEKPKIYYYVPLTLYDVEKECLYVPHRLSWGGDCKGGKCHFSYYLPPSFKFYAYIPSLDKVFVTNEIDRKSFQSQYKVELNSDGAAVITDTTNPFAYTFKLALLSFIVTIILELLYVRAILRQKYEKYKKNYKKILSTVFIANLISLPIVWFVLPLLIAENYNAFWLVAELFAIIFEGLFIYYFNKEDFTIKKALVISFVMNLISVIFGMGFIYIFSNVFI